MMRVLIVDDEPPARENLRLLLADAADVEIVGEAGGGRAAIDAIGRLAPDVVFLDVRMPEVEGFDVIRSVGPERMPLTIFVTAYDRYALEAFEARALDYLLKPFDDVRFAETMERVRERLRERRQGGLARDLASLLREGGPLPTARVRHLTARGQGRVRLVPVADVVVFQASGDYVEAHCDDGRVHLLDDTLRALEASLDPRKFVRVHRSHIVAVDRIVELEPSAHGDWTLRLADGRELRLSRTRRAALEQALGRTL